MHGFSLAAKRDHRRQQAERGFPLLRACPTTEAIKLTLYLDGLDEAERLAFADQLSSLEEEHEARPPASNAEIHARIRSLPLVAGFLAPRMGMEPPVHRPVDLRLTPVKVLAKTLAEQGSDGVEGLARVVRLSDDPAARAPAPVVASSLAEVVPVEPRRLRKLVDDTLKRTFGVAAQRMDSDHVCYAAARPEGVMRVDVMFARPGRLLHQFDYHFSAERPGRPKVWMTTYEDVWRLAARWDGVTQANAERSVAHLAALLSACLDLA